MISRYTSICFFVAMLAVLSPSLEASNRSGAKPRTKYVPSPSSSPPTSPPSRGRAGSSSLPPSQQRQSFVPRDKNGQSRAADRDSSPEVDMHRSSGPPLQSDDPWAPSGQNRGSAPRSSYAQSLPRDPMAPSAPVNPHPQGTRAPANSSKAQSSSTGQSSSSSLSVAQPVTGYFSSFVPQFLWPKAPAALPVSKSSGILENYNGGGPVSQPGSAWDNLPVQKKKELYGRLSKQGEALAAMLRDSRFTKNRKTFTSAIDQFARDSDGLGIPREYAAIPLPQMLTQMQLENLKDLLILQYYDGDLNIDGRIIIPAKYVYPLYSRLCAGNTSFFTEASLDEAHLFECRVDRRVMELFNKWFFPQPDYMERFGVAVANEPYFVTPDDIITAGFIDLYADTITAKGETIFSQFHRTYLLSVDGNGQYISLILSWIFELPEYQVILKGLKIRGDSLNRNTQFYGQVRQLAELSAGRMNAGFKRDDAKWLLSNVAPELMPLSIREKFPTQGDGAISAPTWFAEFFYISEAEIEKILKGGDSTSPLAMGLSDGMHKVMVSDLAMIVDIFSKDRSRRHSAFLALRTFGLLPTYKRGKTDAYTDVIRNVLFNAYKVAPNRVIDADMIESLKAQVQQATKDSMLSFSDAIGSD